METVNYGINKFYDTGPWRWQVEKRVKLLLKFLFSIVFKQFIILTIEFPFAAKYKQGVNRYYEGSPTATDADALLDVYGGIKVGYDVF